MKFLRTSGAVGAAAVITLVGAGSAFAWHPGDVTLSAGCRPDTTHIVLKVTNKFTQGGDFTLSRAGDAHVFKGHVDAKASAKLTVPYSGKGDEWTVKIPPNVTASLKVGPADLCVTPKPTPAPTHSKPSTVPTTPAGQQLAHTGADGTLPAIAAGGALLLGGAVLTVSARRRGHRL